MEEERDGLSLGGILHTIFSQKWLALIIAALLTAGITLALYFGYNPQVTDYVSTFTVSFPGSERSDFIFLDISNFQFREIIALDNLEAAKASDEEKFEYIDVQSMHLNNNISITKGGEEQPSYTIRINAKYFRSRSDATAFIKALAQKPIDYIMSQAAAQDVFLSGYDSAKFYEDKCSLLKKQVNYLTERLNVLSTLTEEELKRDCGELLTELEFYERQLDSAIGEMRKEHYVHDADEVKNEYELHKFALDNQLKTLTRELELIFGRISESDPAVNLAQASKRIEELAKQIAETEELIRIYDEYYIDKPLSEDTDGTFAGKLTELNERLKSLTDSYEDNLKQYCTKTSSIVYAGALYREGDLNVVVCLLIGLIIGLIVAVIVAYIVGAYKLKKTTETSKETPADINDNTDNDKN